MRAFTAALLALTFSTATLSGCGQTVNQAPALNAATSAQASAAKTSATQMARDFADQLALHYGGAVSHRGTTVTLGKGADRTTYEFGQTPKTGKVKVSNGDYSLELAYTKLTEGAKTGEMNAEVLPAMLVPIAIQVGLGAALGVANYWIHHRGDKFVREDAIKAAVEGMLAAMIPITRDLKYVRFLTPLALVLVKSAKTLNYKDLAKAAMDNLDDIVKTLIAIMHDMKTSVTTDAAPVAAKN